MSVLVRLIPKNEPIKIKVGDAARKPLPTIRLELKIRKSLSGDLMIFDHADIDIVLSSKTNKNQIQFWVPKAYFDSAEQEAQFVLNNKQPVIAAPQIVNEAPASKSEEMVQYWFNEGTAADQKQFADWAFSNRSEVKQAMKTDSKPLEMMAYWYEKADKTQKAAILSWLISQE